MTNAPARRYNTAVMAAAPNSQQCAAPSSTRRIAGATAVMMTAILASRLLGLVRNAVISHQFGQKFWADVYYGAFQIPDLLFYLIAGGALSSAFIPVFTEYITNERHEEAWHIFSTVACVMFVAVGVFVILGEVFAAPLVRLVNPGFQAIPGKVEATVPLTRIVLPAQLCFFLGGLLMGTQYSQQKFLVPALGPIVYNLGIIFGGIVLAPWLGVAGLCWGALGGAVVGNFALQLWAVARSGMRFRPSFEWQHPDVVKVWKLMLPVVLGVALPQVSIWINRAFASGLGNGPMAALSNANQFMQVPLGIFAQAMAVAIFPTLSALAAQKRHGELRDTASSGIRALLFLTVPASILMIVLAVPIVQLLLQGGRYGPDDTALAASALAYYCIGIFAWSAQSILARTFYALQDSVTPVVIGTAVTFVFIPMNWFLMKPMGIRGLALATTIAASLHVFVMVGVLSRRLGGFHIARMAASLMKTLCASAIAAVVCVTAASHLGSAAPAAESHVKLHALAVIVVAGGCGVLAYVAAARILHIEEMHLALALLRRRRAAPTADASGS
ncbi:MAG: murein biosynthesis integral membrane protein MurJ [Chthonomonadales bacterium]